MSSIFKISLLGGLVLLLTRKSSTAANGGNTVWNPFGLAPSSSGGFVPGTFTPVSSTGPTGSYTPPTPPVVPDATDIVIDENTGAITTYGYTGADADTTGLPTLESGWLSWLLFDMPKAQAAILAALWGPIAPESREAIAMFYKSYADLLAHKGTPFIQSFGYRGPDADSSGLPTTAQGYAMWFDRNPAARQLLTMIWLTGGVPQLSQQQSNLLIQGLDYWKNTGVDWLTYH